MTYAQLNDDAALGLNGAKSDHCKIVSINNPAERKKKIQLIQTI